MAAIRSHNDKILYIEMNSANFNNLDDSQLKAQFGNRDPFKVPEGYFEGLTSQVMAALPPKEVKQIPLRRPILRWSAAASIVAAVALGGYLINDARQASYTGDTVEMAFSDDEIDETLDYLMVNNNDITTYLTMGE